MFFRYYLMCSVNRLIVFFLYEAVHYFCGDFFPSRFFFLCFFGGIVCSALLSFLYSLGSVFYCIEQYHMHICSILLYHPDIFQYTHRHTDLYCLCSVAYYIISYMTYKNFAYHTLPFSPYKIPLITSPPHTSYRFCFLGASRFQSSI